MDEKKEFNIADRNLAWDIIKKEQLKSLPVSPDYFIKKYKITHWSYRKYAAYHGIVIDFLYDQYGKDGFLILEEDEYRLILNEQMQKNRITWTQMLLISHYILGHVTKENPVVSRLPKSKRPIDLDAEHLSTRILCPSVILHMCSVTSSEEIAKLCGISYGAAEIRWEHLKQLRKNNRFLTLYQEKEIVLQFAPFICQYLCKKFSSGEEHPLIHDTDSYF